jgi:Coenzyme PQQ synthesis protein D (PqqD)
MSEIIRNPVFNSVFVRSKNQLHLIVGDSNQVVVLDTINNEYFGLENVAAKIWQLLETPKSIEHICQEVMLEFEVEFDDISPDVVEFLEKLHAQGLIQSVQS